MTGSTFFFIVGLFCGDGADEDALAALRQPLPSEGVGEEAAVVLPLATMSELGSGKRSTRHHLPPLAFPGHQRPLQEQQVRLTADLFDPC